MENEEATAQNEATSYFPETSIEALPLRRTHKFVKVLKIKIFTDHNTKAVKLDLRAPKGRAFTLDLVGFNLWRIAQQLEAQVPMHIYKCIEVGNGEFNFIWQGIRKLQPKEETECPAGIAETVSKEESEQGTT